MALHWSQNSESVKKLANELSVRWKHHYLSTEHYLYACCQLDGDCGRWLGRRGFTLQTLEEEILRWVPEGDEVPIWEGMIEAPRLRRIITKMCVEEAEAQKSMRVEPKHILAAILSEGGGIAARLIRNRGNELRAVRGELLGGTSVPPVGGSDATRPVPSGEARERTGPSGGGGKEKFLSKYSRDLVEEARQGKIDPVIGRNDEVRRVIQTLVKKGKSNPVLIGEAGVGKTAVAKGLALRIAQGQVPDQLKDRRVLDLSLSSMVAGAKHRGEFEERLEGVVQEATADPTIILFIDEIHQLVGAGDSRGGMDASNILKPALARGDFPVLGATTTDEYRKYIEADPALERRFQMIMVGEPSEADALEILRGLRPRYESHHGVKFTDGALLQAVKLSVRFIPDRNLPDKAIDLIDEAAARIKTRSGVFMAGERPVFEVTEDVIAEVVSDHSGVPVARMTQEETTRLLEIEGYLAERVVGQDHAVRAVAETIRVVRVGLVSPNRPGGVFLFLGPSGVGKTELAKALAEFLFGSDRDLVRLDMSEYHDKHSMSRLIGSPPGYVGSEEEGQLTGAVRTKPYCVVLLDEVEKAHPEVFDIFLQVFDDGRLPDSKGRTVNFANTIIVLTSNLGAREVIASGQQVSEGMAGQLDQLPPLYQKALRGHFRPEFLNRIDEIVSFRSLAAKDLEGIVRIHLKRLVETLKDKEVQLELRQDAIDFLLEVGYQPAFGARPLQRAINTYVSRPLAEEMLRNRTAPGSIVTVYRNGDRLAFSATAGRRPEPPPEPPTRPTPEPPTRPTPPPPRPDALPMNPTPEPPRGGGLANLPLPKRPMRQTGDHTGLSQEGPPPVSPTRPMPDSPTLSGERTYLPLGDSGSHKKPPTPPPPQNPPAPPDSGDPWSNFRRPEERP